MKKLLYYFWGLFIIFLGYSWSLETTFWAGRLPFIKENIWAQIALACLIPVWFFINLKWLLRVIKMPALLYTITEVLKSIGVQMPFSYRLALTFYKRPVYQKYTRIRAVKDIREYNREYTYIIPALIVGEADNNIRSLSAGAYTKHPGDFYSDQLGSVFTPLGLAIAVPLLLWFLGPFFLMLSFNFIDIAKILNTHFAEPNVADLLKALMIILCSAGYLLVSSFLLFYDSGIIIALNKRLLEKFHIYLKSIDYTYKPLNIRIGMDDISSVVMTAVVALLSVVCAYYFVKDVLFM